MPFSFVATLLGLILVNLIPWRASSSSAASAIRSLRASRQRRGLSSPPEPSLRRLSRRQFEIPPGDPSRHVSVVGLRGRRGGGGGGEEVEDALVVLPLHASSSLARHAAQAPSRDVAALLPRHDLP